MRRATEVKQSVICNMRKGERRDKRIRTATELSAAVRSAFGYVIKHV